MTKSAIRRSPVCNNLLSASINALLNLICSLIFVKKGVCLRNLLFNEVKLLGSAGW